MSSKGWDEGEPVSFDEVEASFQKVVKDLIKDKSLDAFRREYEKLHASLVTSREQNSALMAQCKSLNSDLYQNANKISSILSISQNDQHTIIDLRSEFDKAWKIVESTHLREAQSKEIIESLKHQISNLKSIADEAKIVESQKLSSLQKVNAEIDEIQNQIKENDDEIRSLIQQIDSTKSQLITLKKQKDNSNDEYIKTDLMNQKISQEEKEIIIQTQDFTRSLQDRKDNINNLTSQIGKNKKKIAEMKQNHEKLQFNLKEKMGNLQYLQSEKKEIDGRIHELNLELHPILQLNRSTKGTYDDFMNKYNEALNIEKLCKEQIIDLDEENQILTEELTEAKDIKNEIGDDKKSQFQRLQHLRKLTIEVQIKEREANLKNRLATTQINSDFNSVFHLKEKLSTEKRESDKVETQIQIHQFEIQCKKVDQKIDQKEAQNYAKDLFMLNEKNINIEQSIDIIKEQNYQIEKELNEKQIQLFYLQNDLKRMDQILETARKDRDREQRKISDCTEKNNLYKSEILARKNENYAIRSEIAEKDRELLDIHTQILDLKDQIQRRKKENLEFSEEVQKMQNACEDLFQDILKTKHVLDQAMFDISDHKTQKNKIAITIKFSQDQIDKLEIKRKEILENAHIHSYTIQNKNVMYSEKLDQIENHKHELSNLLHTRDSLIYKKGKVHTLQKEIIHLEKQLSETRIKRTLLEEEMKTPMNIHRWRLLESTNPDLMQLIKMKIELVNQIDTLIAKQTRLNRSRSSIKEKKENVESHLAKSYGTGKFLEEKMILKEELKKKNKLMETLETEMQRKLSTLSFKKYEANNVKHAVIQETLTANEIHQKVQKLRNSVSARSERDMNIQSVRSPKYPPNSARGEYSARRHINHLIGGGFPASGNQLLITEVQTTAQFDDFEFLKFCTANKPKSARGQSQKTRAKKMKKSKIETDLIREHKEDQIPLIRPTSNRLNTRINSN